MRRFGLSLAFSMAALMLAVMAMLAAVGFGSLSLYLYLVTVVSPALAALGVAFAACLFAAIVTALGGLIWRVPPRRTRDPDDPLAGLAEALSLGRALGQEGQSYLKTHLSKSAATAFGIGVALGLSPRLRKLIFDLLRQ